MPDYIKRVLITRSNPVHPDPRVEKIARALAQGGYQVDVLGWDRTATLPPLEMTDLNSIYRLRIKADYGSGLGNLPQLLMWQVGLLSWLVQHHDQYDLIHACDFDTILPALLVKKVWSKKIVYDIFDFYADHLRRTPGWIKSIIRKVDLWAIGKADAVILVDEARRNQISGSKPKLVEFIYNSPETNNIPEPARVESHRKFKIAYIGLLQSERGLFEMINVVSKHPEWHLDLAGFGGDENEIIQKSKLYENICFHGRVDYHKALSLSAAADLLFATYDPQIANHKYSSPNKVFEAMMLAKPILVAKQTNMDKIIKDADCGIVIQYGDEKELEQAIIRIANDSAERDRLGQNGRRAYESFYSWEIMRNRLLNLYGQI